MKTFCAYCFEEIDKPACYVNRAAKIGAPMYCNKTCAGLGRRSSKTVEQKKEEKRLYDMAYRDQNKEKLKAKKAEYFRRTYDPAQAAIRRKATMAQHVEYCRRPEYKSYKRNYDKQYRADRQYGSFAGAFLLLLEIENEVRQRMTKCELAIAKGTLNKAQTRRREYERLNCNQS